MRKDKTFLYKSGKDMFGNNKYIANDIFRAIKNPVTEEMITTGNLPIISVDNVLLDQKSYYNRNNSKRLVYQNFHNHYIKVYLLQFSSPSYIQGLSMGYHGKLLDLCCGRGVDINKIKKARYAEVVGMDIDYNNIIEAQELFKSMIIPPPKAYYVRGDSSKLIFPEQASGITEADKIYTKKYIPSKYLFDTVSIQFCFHYFFEKEIFLRTILQNINDNLKIGGYVIGTTFDGERVNNLFKNDNIVSGKSDDGDIIWKIEKKYSGSKLSFSNTKANYGKQIDVFVRTIGVVHPEYLVNFYYLDKIMMEYGFTKVFVKPFEEFYNELMEGKNVLDLNEKDFKQNQANVQNMTEDQKKYSFLNSAFMYKKEKNSSDSLMKKLIELMLKKSKLKMKEEITAYEINQDTENIIENTLLKS
jgi:mRNA (guanine-N7-)-methyltransferase